MNATFHADGCSAKEIQQDLRLIRDPGEMRQQCLECIRGVDARWELLELEEASSDSELSKRHN